MGDERKVRGYMCQIDWQWELGEASGGSRIYPSEGDLLCHHSCADECGIVEVEVSLVRVVKESSY